VASHGAFDWATIAYLGVVQIGVAYLLLTRGFRNVTAFEGSLLILLEPTLSPIWAWFAQGEVPGAWALAGGATILVATTTKTWLDQRRTP
jgi:drug/metabolite transporter (DMT)-like permease